MLPAPDGNAVGVDWERLPGVAPADPAGVGALLDRARAALGELSGTRFVHDSREMLEATRAIEARALGVAPVLYVGFQDVERFEETRPLYDRDVGTRVVAFGLRAPRHAPAVEWVEVPDNPRALENQWFLVADTPAPMGLVGYETSAETHRRVGPAGSADRTWEGFRTRDPRLVAALVDHLEAVRRRHGG